MSHHSQTKPIVTILAAVLFALTALPAGAEEANDPLETMNRGVFWFNDQLDIYALEPVARGWHWLMPDRVETCVSNFFANLRFPTTTLNNLLQGKVVNAGSNVGRFVVNTTVGVVGLFDPATDWGMPEHDEDFGQTLGVWGVPPGPYLVLPLFGPSNIRDGVGTVADSYTLVYPWLLPMLWPQAFPWYSMTGAQVVRVVNARGQVLTEVEEIKAASVDYYSAVRDGYTQRRRTQVGDGAEMSEEEQEDLYNVEEE